MLIAWARGKKGRLWKGYEDEIVSAVFGPLRYVSGSQRGEVFRRIFEGAFEQPLANVEHGTVEFWPNIARRGRGRIEPDIEVMLSHAGPPSIDTVLLIEAKWDAPQSEDQLSTQWIAATAHYAPRAIWHVFLTRDPHSMESMLGPSIDPMHSEHLANLTWTRLASIVRSLAEETPSREFRCWSSDVCEFLSDLGTAPFVGFLKVANEHCDWDSGQRWGFQPTLLRLAELLYLYIDSIELWSTRVWHFCIGKEKLS